MLEHLQDLAVGAVRRWLERVGLGDATELARPESGATEAVPHGVDDHVGRVAHSVDATDLVAVVGGNRNLDDLLLRRGELQDDLGVEVESVGVGDEREIGECTHAVGAVARVPLRQIEARQRVLRGAEDPVADVLVERHAALSCSTALHHARTEHGVGVAVHDRLDDVAHALGRVLTVAVEEYHDIPAVVEGIQVTGLLVAAVAEILFVPNDGEIQVAFSLEVHAGHRVRRIGRVIVAHQYLGELQRRNGRDPVENVDECGFSVVGDNEHANLHGCTPSAGSLGGAVDPKWVSRGGRSRRRGGSCRRPDSNDALPPGHTSA